MRKGFTELPGFTRWIVAFMSDIEYARLQYTLMENPDIGSVMPGCGGMRKVRVGDVARGLGKRGGARVVYLHVPEVDRIILVAGYEKTRKADLSADEKRQLQVLARQLKDEVIEWARRRK